jgi:hypothetical protein
MSLFTRNQSLQELIASGARARSHRSVLRALALHGAQTDLSLAGLSGVSRSGVCGRVAELIAIDYVEECEPVRCSVTKKLVRRSRLTAKGAFATAQFIEREQQIEREMLSCGVMVA